MFCNLCANDHTSYESCDFNIQCPICGKILKSVGDTKYLTCTDALCPNYGQMLSADDIERYYESLRLENNG